MPSAKTYPIGSSGAIISDKIDDTEYLCCFLAKEKRIVVFDLTSKVIVVSSVHDFYRTIYLLLAKCSFSNRSNYK